jgi:hypothetical protein
MLAVATGETGETDERASRVEAKRMEKREGE